ncbi:MAG: SCO family protein [Beijerinckiaceae bacterium]|nr:SCO family protein [Beijerinckiaceae bacterium]
MRSSRLVLPLVLFVFSALALGLVLFVVLGRPQGSGIGGPFTLTNQAGQKVTERVLESPGATLVFFGFTHCPDVCPTTLYEVTQLYQALGPKGDRLRTLFITVDPERDTPELLRDYISSFDPRIVGLTGSPEQTAAALKAYRGYARKVPLEGNNYTMDHTALVYLMDSKGRFIESFNLKRPPEQAAKELQNYL